MESRLAQKCSVFLELCILCVARKWRNAHRWSQTSTYLTLPSSAFKKSRTALDMTDEELCCWKCHYFVALNKWISEPCGVQAVFSFNVPLTFDTAPALCGWMCVYTPICVFCAWHSFGVWKCSTQSGLGSQRQCDTNDVIMTRMPNFSSVAIFIKQ